MTCKFWINPLALAKNYGFSAKELNTIRAIIIKNKNRIDGTLDSWYDVKIYIHIFCNKFGDNK